MTLTELIDYIGDEWPDVYDANSCARWILNTFNENEHTVDQLICFWSRHEHD